MRKSKKDKLFENLPACAAEFVKLVIKKMRYRKKVHLDVQAELIAYFEDELKDCTTDEEREQKARQLITEFGDAKLIAVLLRRAKKRCRPLWRTVVARTFQTIWVIILCFIVYCVYISLGRPTINVNYVEQATGLVRPLMDEGQNAAPLYQKAIQLYKEPPQIEQQDKFLRPRKVSLLTAIKDNEWIDDLTEEELSALKQWISNNAEAIGFFKQASEKPYCWWQREAENNVMLEVLLPELAPIRSHLVKIMSWSAKLKAYDGNIEGAFDDLLVCYRVGRHFKGPRLLIEQLVGVGIQTLMAKTAIIIMENQPIQGRILRDFQAMLEKLMADDSFIVDYEVEGFWALDFIQRCYTDNGSGSGHMIPVQVKEFLQFIEGDFCKDENILEKVVIDHGRSLAMAVISADRRKMSQAFKKVYHTAQVWACKTPWQLREQNVDLEMGLADWSPLKRARYCPMLMLAPSVERVNELAHRRKTYVEVLITTIALLRYNKNTGRYPENLNELINADYLKQLPMDPYSNKPLVYKVIGDDFTLYSLGADFDDDGGVHSDDWGRTEQGGDQVFWPIEKTDN